MVKKAKNADIDRDKPCGLKHDQTDVIIHIRPTFPSRKEYVLLSRYKSQGRRDTEYWEDANLTGERIQHIGCVKITLEKRIGPTR